MMKKYKIPKGSDVRLYTAKRTGGDDFITEQDVIYCESDIDTAVTWCSPFVAFCLPPNDRHYVVICVDKKYVTEIKK